MESSDSDKYTRNSGIASIGMKFSNTRNNNDNNEEFGSSSSTDGLHNVAYLKKAVVCSQKMRALQRDTKNCTVGEMLLLEGHSSSKEDAFTSSSLTSSWTPILSKDTFVPLSPVSQKNSKLIEMFCGECGDLSSSIISGRANFSCCPPEVNFKIFSMLPETQILRCRLVCQTWRTQIDIFFAFHSVLNADKIYRYREKIRTRMPFEITHYDLEEFTRHLKHKHFYRIPEPSSIRILKKISSKNFLKIIDCWRNIESLTIFVEPLTCLGLFQKWSYYHPLEYFPKLKKLNIHLDRLHLAKYKSFNPKQLRFNLDQILMNPYTHLETFSFQMLNSGRHFACAFIAPILMFIGRQGQSLKDAEVVFHTGYELDTLPAYSSEQHAPTYYVPLDDQIYVHGEVNLTLLPHVKLVRCSLAVPAVSGCTTRSGICNYFTKLLESQQFLKIVQLETQVGIQMKLIDTIIQNNRQSLKEIEATIEMLPDEVLDMEIFRKCQSLSSLRLKRVGFVDTPNLASQISNLDKLPKTLVKISLHRFYMSVVDLFMVTVDKPKLECLCICSCFIKAIRSDEPVAEETLTRILIHPELKFLCFSPVRRNTLNKVLFHFKTNEELNTLLTFHGWLWSVLSRELWLAKPRRLILYRGEEYCTKAWFKPYFFEKVKV